CLNIDCPQRLRIALAWGRARSTSHEAFAGFPLHRAFRKEIAAFERLEVIQTRRWIERSREPIRPALESRTDIGFAVDVRFQLIQNRPALGIEPFRPVQIFQKLLAQQKLAIRSIEHIEEPVSIRLKQKLSRLALPICIDENRWFLRVPIMNVMWR